MHWANQFQLNLKLVTMTFLTSAKSNTALYCELTALHGFAYLVSGRNVAATIFWVLAVLVSVLWALWNCINSFIDLQAEPIILNIQTLKYSPDRLAYPAITICPMDDTR